MATKKLVKQTNEQKLKKKIAELKESCNYWQGRYKAADQDNDDLVEERDRLRKQLESRRTEERHAMETRVHSLTEQNSVLNEIIRWQINPETAVLSEQDKQNRQNAMGYGRLL